MKRIEIIVTPNGGTHIETKGFTGSECRNATRQIEEALGIVRNDQPTAEMYAPQLAECATSLHISPGCTVP
ncbi:MAG: DUF2997 domain-containing protein [Pirellulales bacterium]